MSRPTDLPNGYLGGQPKFGELKLHLDSHKHPEFKVSGDNHIVIKMKTGMPLKVTTKLHQCSKKKDLAENVFIQRKRKEDIRFHISFPENGWYKFQVFALDESNPAESLPNVYNYLIDVERISKPGLHLVKAYTKFYKDSCFLDEPLCLNSHTPNLDHVKFEVIVPDAQKVAVHAVQEWFQLTKKSGDKWEGTVNLSSYKGKNSKITVNASYEKEGQSYSTLLEYTI